MENQQHKYGWNMKTQRKYSWIPSLPDYRNRKFEEFVKDQNLETQVRPVSISLRPWCSEVVDQGNLGCCTSCAVTSLVKYNLNRNKTVSSPLSRLYLYYNQRRNDDSINWDDGDTLTDAVKMVRNYGICQESLWPYDLRRWKVQPPPPCYTDAQQVKVTSYYNLDILDDMKTSLANYHPFVFGFSVYESFESDAVANTGIVPIPAKTETLLGGHAVMAVGYDDIAQRFLIKNSWGKKWGLPSPLLRGYFTIPYTYLMNRNLSDDFWVIV